MNILHRLHNHDPGIDFSYTLREEMSWHPGTLNKFTIPPDIASSVNALTIDPLLGIMAVGTSSGNVMLFGAPPVTTVLKVPFGMGRSADGAKGVKFLAFISTMKRLACVDSENVLHIWNLDPQQDQPRPPILILSLPFPENISAMVVSPAHSHILLALETGEIMTFDADRLCPSPYVIQNLWLQHQDHLRRTGELPGADEHSNTPVIMEVVLHPRDLNLVFIAYDGGVILWNISSRTSVHTYRLALHPGAKGGGGYNQEQVFTERYPSVTAISAHPSGYIIAIGHLDGCISFWAVEDSERPLAVRTLSEPFSFIDAHVPDPMALIDEDNGPRDEVKGAREPIFKLAWSGYPSIKDPNDYGTTEMTTLTILGGTLPMDPLGVIVLAFPPIILPTPDMTSGPASPSFGGNQMLPPSTRQALKTSLFPSETLDTEPRSFFPSSTLVEDFFLIPRNNPHMNGVFDPLAIILLTSASDTRRKKSILTCVEFPPQSQDLAPSERPALRRMRLPLALGLAYPSKGDEIVGAEILKFDNRQTFGRLLSAWVNSGDIPDSYTGRRLPPLRAGSAWSDFDGDDAPDRRLSKFDYHRALITNHRDLTVRIYDLSSQLLLSQSALQFEFPQLLPHLTIEVGRVLLPPPVTSPLDEDFPTFSSSRSVRSSSMQSTAIVSVSLARTSLECAIVLSDGTVTTWKLMDAGSPTQAYNISAEDADIIMPLEPFIRSSERRRTCFHPFCLIKPPKSTTVSAFAFNDVGFVAIAYSDDSLVVVDLRGPRTVLKRDWAVGEGEKDKVGPVLSLTWSICGLGTNGQHRLRLLSAHQSGTMTVYTLHLDPESQHWQVNLPNSNPRRSSVSYANDYVFTVNQSSLATPLALFVLDGKSGEECFAVPPALQQIMTAAAEDGAGSVKSSKDKTPVAHCFLVMAGKKEARCFEDISGTRVGTAEWGAHSKEAVNVLKVKVVNRSGYQVLVAFRDDHKAAIYSLPELEFLHLLDLPIASNKQIIADADAEGDYLLLTPAVDSAPALVYSTLFHMRRPLPPLIDFGEPQLPSIEAYPLPQATTLVSSAAGGGLGSWIWGSGPKVFRGQDIDAVLAGPDRPPPAVAPVKRPTSGQSTSPTVRKGIAPAASEGRGDLFSRLKNAAMERGENLAQLNETFSSLETSSRDMVAQAKRLAAEQSVKQSARGWRPFG